MSTGFSYVGEVKENASGDQTYWFCQARIENIPISGLILKEKALHFTKERSITDFKASDCWLSLWKDWYSIKTFKVSGERADMDQREGCLRLTL